MRFAFLDSLRCPHCGSQFDIELIIEQNKNELTTGVVRCECSEFPILEGILDLNAGALDCQIVSLVKERKVEEATIRSLSGNYRSDLQFVNSSNSIFSFGSALLSQLVKNRKYRNNSKFYALYKRSTPFFYLLGNEIYDKYLKQRFSSESFWSLYPFIPVLKNKKERILDLSCGMGHSSFIISKYIKPQQLCCADKSYRFLYLARKYFAPDADFVCLDANSPLPFKERIFSSVLMLDSFHNVTERMLLANEMKRVIFPQGLLLLLHLHNSLTKNLGDSFLYSMTPKAWVNLFETQDFRCKAIPQGQILNDFLFHNVLDLATEPAQNILNSSNAIALLATSDESVFRTYENVKLDFLSLRDNLIINPIYDIKQNGHKIEISRPSSIDAFGDYLVFSEKFLPKKDEIPSKFFTGRHVVTSDSDIISDLMAKFIVVNVPKNYI